ncbi:putative PAS/PAC sensor protein [Planoprotostelium fungivorum]|uniref:Putative PAS/PAC sensor protein n=1 Tax=Planoprotostelium fungivorum TaxID=1890364 RepID=A0A2P6NXP2_9EUKA|nr:putative PAS/PAC sensor protein [Planoprotostelium fungivorum]
MSSTQEGADQLSNTRMAATGPTVIVNLDHFMCPITLEFMQDPVCTPYGHCFERSAIETLNPCFALRDTISDVMACHPDLMPHPSFELSRCHDRIKSDSAPEEPVKNRGKMVISPHSAEQGVRESTASDIECKWGLMRGTLSNRSTYITFPTPAALFDFLHATGFIILRNAGDHPISLRSTRSSGCGNVIHGGRITLDPNDSKGFDIRRYEWCIEMTEGDAADLVVVGFERSGGGKGNGLGMYHDRRHNMDGPDGSDSDSDTVVSILDGSAPPSPASSQGGNQHGNAQPVVQDEVSATEVLYRGPNSVVFRTDQPAPVTIKCAHHGYPSSALWKRYRRDIQIGLMLTERQNNYVVGYLGLQKNLYSGHSIIMNHFDGVSIPTLIERVGKLDVLQFLRLSLNCIKGIGAIHSDGVIHRNISPLHILVDRELQIKYIDFSAASVLEKQYQATFDSQLLHGRDLQYISPEQTGRMNKDIDYRTDYYSLGVVLYSLLCGHTPFYDAEPSRLIYAHIAKNPTPPHDIDTNTDTCKIPTSLSHVVLKMLAKNADDRYQSVFGIQSDLLKCMDLLGGGLAADFIVGGEDMRSRFRISQRLYGREEEIDRLSKIFDGITRGKISRSMIMVSGYSGVGKTALINELHKPLTKFTGNMLLGKVDQFNRSIPFSCIVQAFQQFVANLLLEPAERVKYWRETILSCLGAKGSVITDVIPELSHIIGRQPPVPQLQPTEAQNRFKQTFVQFVSALAQPSHPLVLFLDDLQWADIPTLLLIETILTNANINNLMLVGAYRDNEVDNSHPLTFAMSRIREKMKIHELKLEPLRLEHITSMISDSFYSSKEDSEPLASLTMKKTDGNPFFITMFLTNLHRKGLVSFDSTTGSWTWDMRRITSEEFTDNVVDMMIQRIRQLNLETQRVLALAAAIGNKFQLKTLALISKQPESIAAQNIWPAITDGLLLIHGEDLIVTGVNSSPDYNLGPSRDDRYYQFLHDRVQQAAYETIDEEGRKQIHLDISRLLLASEEEKSDDILFDILVHFTVAYKLLVDPVEKEQVARLFLKGSQLARKSSALQSAHEYAKIGIDLLVENYWEHQYDLALGLHKLEVETEYARGNYDAAEKKYPILLEKCKTRDDKIAIYRIQIHQFEVQCRYEEVYNVSRLCLKYFDFDIPELDAPIEVLQPLLDQEHRDIERNLNGRAISTLDGQLPLLQDPERYKCLDVLVWLWAPCFCIGNVRICGIVCGKMANFTLAHGLCDLSSATFTHYGFVCPDNRRSYEFGALGCRLIETYPNEPLRGRVYSSFAVSPCNLVMPLPHAYYFHDRAFESALEQGDLPMAAYSAHHCFAHRWFGGDSLASAVSVYNRVQSFLKETNAFVHEFALAEGIPILWHLNRVEQVEEEFVRKNKEKEWEVNISVWHNSKLQCLFWADSRDWTLVFEAIDLVRTNMSGVNGFWAAKEIKFIMAMLCLSALADGFMDTIEASTTNLGREDVSQIINEGISEFETLASTCPANAHHKLLMLRAQQARVNGDIMTSIKLFTAAKESAGSGGFQQYEALASEMAGRLFHTEELPACARPYIQQARYNYSTWGSITKTDQLEREFPEYLKVVGSKEDTITTEEEEMEREVQNSAKAITRLTESIHTDTKPEQLLRIMIRALLEHSGARRARFILVDRDNDKNLFLVAESDAEDLKSIVQFSSLEVKGHTSGVIHYVARTREVVRSGNMSSTDTIMSRLLPLNTSVLCVPMTRDGRLLGVVYLENNLVRDAFTPNCLKLVTLITSEMSKYIDTEDFSSSIQQGLGNASVSFDLATMRRRMLECTHQLYHELRKPGSEGENRLLFEYLDSMEKSLPTCNEDHTKTDQGMRKMLEDISFYSDHMRRVLDTVSAVSTTRQDQKEDVVTFAPRYLMENVATIFGPGLESRGITLNLISPDSDVLVAGNIHRISQAVIHMASFACRMKEMGTLTMRLTHHCINNNELSLHISMEGIGENLTEEQLDSLSRGLAQGSGSVVLGPELRWSRDAIQELGGEIKVISMDPADWRIECSLSCERVESKKRKWSVADS